MGKIYIGDLFSKKVTKRRPIWAKSLLWRLSVLKGDPFGNTAFIIESCPYLCSGLVNKTPTGHLLPAPPANYETFEVS